jgi:hypothetical protein
MTMLSMNDRWLLASTTGPSSGTFSRPVMCGRRRRNISGRSTKRAIR